jgi:hypothetical protein
VLLPLVQNGTPSTIVMFSSVMGFTRKGLKKPEVGTVLLDVACDDEMSDMLAEGRELLGLAYDNDNEMLELLRKSNVIAIAMVRNFLIEFHPM